MRAVFYGLRSGPTYGGDSARHFVDPSIALSFVEFSRLCELLHNNFQACGDGALAKTQVRLCALQRTDHVCIVEHSCSIYVPSIDRIGLVVQAKRFAMLRRERADQCCKSDAIDLRPAS